MVLPYAASWVASNEAARLANGPLWVVLGDSTAQGVGASAFDRGYVGLVRNWLDGHTGRSWRVLNLSRSGARAAGVLEEQVPLLLLESAAGDPDLVTLSVGANDIVRRTPLRLLERTLESVLDHLPERSVVATLPQGLGRRPAEVNRTLVRLAGERGLLVADLWSRTGPPWGGKFAADGFHPNDTGYLEWAGAFIDALAFTR